MILPVSLPPFTHSPLSNEEDLSKEAVGNSVEKNDTTSRTSGHMTMDGIEPFNSLKKQLLIFVCA